MPIRIVQSKQNAWIKELRKTLEHPARVPGRVAVEGPHLLTEAIRSGLRVVAVFVALGSEDLLRLTGLDPESDSTIDVLAVPGELLAACLTTEAPQPIAALVEPPVWSWNALLGNQLPGGRMAGRCPLLVMLAGLQDPGNLGAILRSAEAFGATGAIALPGTASPWNPKALRASAGSAFRLPFLGASVEESFANLKRAEIAVLAAMPSSGPSEAATPSILLETSPVESIADVNLDMPLAFLIGNEGHGLTAELANQAAKRITIPCPGQVESLNAAVAAGVLLYEAARQRSGSVPTPGRPSAPPSIPSQAAAPQGPR